MKSVMFGPDPATGRVCRLAGVSVQQGRPVMALADFPDRTAIEAVRGTKLWIQRSEIKIDESSEYLWSDVIGSEVFDAAGQRMGLVVEMANYGASDIAVIEAESGARLDLPFVGVYVDMSFRGADKRISLLVESAVFADLWSKN